MTTMRLGMPEGIAKLSIFLTSEDPENNRPAYATQTADYL